jgi:protein SMG8
VLIRLFQGFLPIWSTLKSKYCKYLLLMFSLSHIMILSDTGGSFDTSYLHLFRVLDAVRLEIKPAIVRKLEGLGTLPREWVAQGRLCSPRLLCLFEVEQGVEVPCPKTAVTLLKNPIKQKQTRLEDEIYHILRKCRIITNIR